ncbi:hypothetical protein ACKKBF_B32500 [Auxenochlorella protothecoides x Auxenochlorella symbiontica]
MTSSRLLAASLLLCVFSLGSKSVASRNLLAADHAVSWKLGVTYPTLNIPSGDSVTWSWDGGVPHNVASAPGAGRCDDLQVLSNALSTEGNFSKTFDSAGTYYFACEVDVHCQDGMQITIQVS